MPPTDYNPIENMPDFYWWDAPSEDSHHYIFNLVSRLRDDQKYLQSENLQHYRLYNDENYSNLGLGGISRPLNSGTDRRRVTLNVIKSMCDTVTAKIGKQRPKATFLTSGGDWAQQRKAELLDKFCQGQFYESGIYEEAPKVFLDSAVFGTGCMKIYQSGDKITAERVFPDEIIVDVNESRYGFPRSLFQTKLIARDVVKGMFPEHKKLLDDTEQSKGEENLKFRTKVEEHLEVVESWHLPSSPDAHDGKHIIACSNVTLLNEEWEYEYFPFVWIKWSDRLLGFWGKGLCEELIGIQVEINKLLSNIQEQMHLAKPKLLLETGSKTSKSDLNNEIWGIVEYTGNPPQFYVPKSVSGEVFSHLDRLFERAYEISGISQLAAQSKKPAGLESGVALREFQDIESERFVIVAQKYEQLFMDSAKQMIQLARDAVDRGFEYSVVSHGDKSIEQIDWKKINLSEDMYVMKVFPTSLLPTTPAARLQSVIDLSQSGLLQDPSTLVKLLEFPDIEAVTKLMTADSDIIDLIVERITMEGVYTPPEPYMNLRLCITRVQQAYIRAKINSVPEKKLGLLRTFIQDCEKLLANMAMAAQPTGMPTPPPGMGVPGEIGEPLGPEGGIPMAGGPPGAIPMPPGGGMPGGGPPASAPPPELMNMLTQGPQ